MQNNENENITFNRDVAAMVRVARVANALAFAGYTPGIDTYVNGDVRQRQQMIGAYLTAGYLLDAVQLANELAGRYIDMDAFEGMMTFALRVFDWTDVLDEIARNPCRTLDPGGAETEEAVGKYYVDIDSLLDSSTRGYSYESHPAVQRLDYELLTRGLRDKMSREGVDQFVVNELPQLVKAFHAGARPFIAAMHARLKGVRATESLAVTT